MAKAFPTSVAQDKVLAALNMTANDFTDAERIFAEIGIVVNSKRVGRSSEPVVSRKDSYGGGWNEGGDGESYRISYKSTDLTPLAQWMK